jgi:hypothetical protein
MDWARFLFWANELRGAHTLAAHARTLGALYKGGWNDCSYIVAHAGFILEHWSAIVAQVH